jgi:hypothetical protein
MLLCVLVEAKSNYTWFRKKTKLAFMEHLGFDFDLGF